MLNDQCSMLKNHKLTELKNHKLTDLVVSINFRIFVYNSQFIFYLIDIFLRIFLSRHLYFMASQLRRTLLRSVIMASST